MSSVPPPRDPLDPRDPVILPPVDEQDQLDQESRFREYLPWVLIAILGIVILAGLGIWYFTKGSSKKPVPAVVGLRIDEAVSRLQDDGFRFQTQREASSRAPGIVFGQNPREGTDESKGSTVKLLVSRGPSRVAVPNAVGEHQAQARSTLVQAGFVVTSAEVFSDQPAGTVVAQAPSAGVRAAPGSKVRVNVSKGSATVDVPSELGMTVDQAQSDLASKGFKTTVANVPSDQPVGTVVAQSPTGGPARTGSSVRLNVSKGAPASTVTTTTDTTSTETTTATDTTTVTTPTTPDTTATTGTSP